MALNLDSQPKKLEFCPLDCENSPRPGLANDHHDALVTVITAKLSIGALNQLLKSLQDELTQTKRTILIGVL